MNLLALTLQRVAHQLAAGQPPWALVGGFAVSIRAEPRFTADVDLAVAVADDSAAEHLVRDLISVGYRLLASIEQDETARLATVRLELPTNEDVGLDLLFASSGIEAEVVAAAERIEILPGLTVPVARTGHLIALKLLARDDESRPQDIADLHALYLAASGADLALAREAVRLIVGRGYGRGRDLEQALDEVVR